MGKTRPPYPLEFRAEAVRLVQESGKSQHQIARDLGVADQSLHNWVKQGDLDAGRRAIFDYIEGFYNPHRRHSTIGYLSPAEWERRWWSDQLRSTVASTKSGQLHGSGGSGVSSIS